MVQRALSHLEKEEKEEKAEAAAKIAA